MPFTSQGLTDLYQRRKWSAEPEETGGHVISALWKAISPETKRVFDKYMGGQYEGAGFQDVAADFLPEDPSAAMAQPNALGMTKLVRIPGEDYGLSANAYSIKSIHDKTKQLLGELIFEREPGQAAVFHSLESETPRGTAEMLAKFRKLMGPKMDDVRVPGPIAAESVPAFQSWIDRGRLNEWPNLRDRFQQAIDNTKQQLPEYIPQRGTLANDRAAYGSYKPRIGNRNYPEQSPEFDPKIWRNWSLDDDLPISSPKIPGVNAPSSWTQSEPPMNSYEFWETR